jgi:hypothetical protein
VKTLELKLANMGPQERNRLDFRIRMCDGEALSGERRVSEEVTYLRVNVEDDAHDLLIDTLLDTPGVRNVRTLKEGQ